MAIDRDTITKTVLQDTREPATGWVAKGVLGYTPNADRRRHQVQPGQGQGAHQGGWRRSRQRDHHPVQLRRRSQGMGRGGLQHHHQGHRRQVRRRRQARLPGRPPGPQVEAGQVHLPLRLGARLPGERQLHQRPVPHGRRRQPGRLLQRRARREDRRGRQRRHAWTSPVKAYQAIEKDLVNYMPSHPALVLQGQRGLLGEGPERQVRPGRRPDHRPTSRSRSKFRSVIPFDRMWAGGAAASGPIRSARGALSRRSDVTVTRVRGERARPAAPAASSTEARWGAMSHDDCSR